MGFQFSLATVLKVREDIEEREERALQRIKAEMARVENEIDSLTAQIAREHREREEALLRPMAAAHLHALLADSQAAEERKKALLKYLQTLDLQRQQQMTVYQAAHHARETLSNMSEKQREVYDQEQTRVQQKNLDEIFMSRHHHS
jgi:flagellar export protein FliJ